MTEQMEEMKEQMEQASSLKMHEKMLDVICEDMKKFFFYNGDTIIPQMRRQNILVPFKL